MYEQMTLPGIDMSISSPGSAAGRSRSRRRAGPTTVPSGPAPAPASPSALPATSSASTTPRHLWPQFRRLIAERRPATVFGEQVAGASRWLNLVRSDLEEMGYAVGAIPIEAASAGADHFRDRYWFVADDDGERAEHSEREQRSQGKRHPDDRAPAAGGRGADGRCGALADDLSPEWRPLPQARQHDADRQDAGGREATGRSGLGDQGSSRVRPLADGHGHGQRSQIQVGQSSDIGPECPTVAGDRVRDVVGAAGLGWGEGWTEHEFRSRGFTAAVASVDGCQYLECPDGKWRRLPPPGVRWLGTRIPARVAKLRAFGNAIDPRPASAFIAAFMECRP